MKEYFEVRPVLTSDSDTAEILQTEITAGKLDEDGKAIDPQTAMDSLVATQLSIQSNRPLIGGKVQPAPEVKYYRHVCHHDSVPVRPCELIEIDPETLEPIKG